MRKIQVVAGIVWKDGCFLAARRSPGKRGEGFWEFPGGKIEPDETREQALARELKEELGIEVSDCEYWKSEEHSYAGYIIALHFYHVREFSNTPMMIEGHDALAWVSPSFSRPMPRFCANSKNFTPPGRKRRASFHKFIAGAFGFYSCAEGLGLWSD